MFLRLSFPAFVDRSLKLNKTREMKAYLNGLKDIERRGDGDLETSLPQELSGETVEGNIRYSYKSCV